MLIDPDVTRDWLRQVMWGPRRWQLASAAAAMKPEVTRRGALDMQVCVPHDWTDQQVKHFADTENPCGTDHGWAIRKQGDKLLAGANERVSCADRPGYVHIMLDA